MTPLETLIVKIQADTAQMRSELDKLGTTTRSAAQSTKASFLDIETSLKGLAARAGPLIAGFVTVSAIKAASDFAEMHSKFKIVFGEFAADTQKWAEEMGAKVGRFSGDLMGMAASLQDTFVPFGFAREEAAKLSRSLTELAVDVASFNNKADEEVIRDFQSALVGNTETLRKYGVVITQATLDAELLKEGVKGGANAATEAQKAFARHQLLLAGTADAQGDAERTAGGFANQLKATRAEIKQLAVDIGEKLMPQASEFLGWVKGLVEGLDKAVTAVDKFADANRGLMKIWYQMREASPLVSLGRGRGIPDFAAAGEEFDRKYGRRGASGSWGGGASGSWGDDKPSAPPPGTGTGTSKAKKAAAEKMSALDVFGRDFQPESIDYLKEYNAEQQRGGEQRNALLARAAQLENEARKVGMSQLDLIKQKNEEEKTALDFMGKQLGVSQEIIDKMKENLDKIANEDIKNLKDATTQWAFSLNSALQNAIMNSENLGKTTLRWLKQAVLFGTDGNGGILGGLLHKATGGLGKLMGGLFGGFFADGGRPPTGRPSIVGERGPEIFVPDAAGTVFPNGSGPGGGGGGANVTIEQHLHFDVGLETVEDRIRRSIPIAATQAQAAVTKSLRQNRDMARYVR